MSLVLELSRLTLEKLCVFDIAKANKDIGVDVSRKTHNLLKSILSPHNLLQQTVPKNLA